MRKLILVYARIGSCLLSYRGLNELISIGTSSDGEAWWGGGVASHNWCRRLAKGLSLHPLRLVKNKWRLEQRCWCRGHCSLQVLALSTTAILSPTATFVWASLPHMHSFHYIYSSQVMSRLRLLWANLSSLDMWTMITSAFFLPSHSPLPFISWFKWMVFFKPRKNYLEKRK